MLQYKMKTGEGMSYNFSNRQISMLRLLITSKDIIAGNELAALVDVSARTVRSDIVQINQILDEKKVSQYFRIVSHKTRGYQIEVHDEVEFCIFQQNFDKEESTFYTNLIREDEIILFLVFLDKVKFDKLGNMMYLSEFIIRKHLKKVQSMLRRHELELKSGNELRIVGNEHRIRMVALNMLYLDQVKVDFNENLIPIIRNTELEEAIRMKLIETVSKYKQISLSARALDSLARYLHLCIMRNKHNHPLVLDVVDTMMITKYPIEMEVAETLFEFVFRKYGYSFERSEIYFFAALIASFDHVVTIENSMFSQDTVNLCERMTKRVIEITHNRDVNTYNEIQMDMLQYLYSLDLRLHFRIYRKYMGSNRIKRKRTVSIELARVLAEEILRTTQKSLPDSEIVLLSVYIGNVFIRARAFSEKNDILIASQYGLCEANRFRNSMRYRYGRYIGNVNLCETYEVQKQMDPYDLVFVDDKRLVEKLAQNKVIFYESYISVFQLEEQVKNRIKHEITNASSLISKLDNKSIIADFKAHHKEDVLEFIANQAVRDELEARDILERLKKKEGICSYECGNKAAVISVRHNSIESVYYRIIVLKREIMWYRHYTQLIIVVYSNETPINIRYCGGSINRLIANVDNINRLINKPSIKTLEELLRVF